MIGPIARRSASWPGVRSRSALPGNSRAFLGPPAFCGISAFCFAPFRQMLSLNGAERATREAAGDVVPNLRSAIWRRRTGCRGVPVGCDAVGGRHARTSSGARRPRGSISSGSSSMRRGSCSSGGWRSTPRRPTCSRAPAPLPPSAGLASGAVAIGGAARRASRKQQATTYGSARWADVSDVRDGRAARRRAASCSASTTDRYLRHDGPEHVLAVAPTRSGKGVGLVLPTLLTWPGSAVIHDIKGENWAADRRLARQLLALPAVRSHQPALGPLQPAAGGAQGRARGARCAEHRRHPGRSGRRARAARPLGEDRARAADRRHPARALRRGRRRRWPASPPSSPIRRARSCAPSRSCSPPITSAPTRRRMVHPGGGLRSRASCSTSPTTSARAWCRPP